jgi:peptidoglycan DL-endopeptidase CwlO
MKKKLVVVNITVMLGLGSVFALPTAKADSISNIQSQRSSIQATINQTNQEINLVQGELSKLNEQLKRAEQAFIDNQNMITKTENDIAAANIAIPKLEKEIASLQESIAKRNAILKERARSYQVTGGDVRYLDVVLGSKSFSDFVDRVGAVVTFMNADKGLLDELEAEKIEVEEKQASLEMKLVELTNMKTELDGMRAQILEQKQQNELLKEELKQREGASLAAKAGLQQQDQSLAAQEAQLAPKQATGSKGNSGSAAPSKGTASTVPVPAAINQGSSERIRIVTTVGNKYIGNSVYVFGGGRNAYDVANGRFDCSGFVHWAFAQAGISVGASTDSLKNSGRKVSKSEMRAGDLVFFNTYKTDGHVGIYLGGGRFIGSQSSTGVAIANMSSGYWASTFNGRVVRIIE